MLRQYQSNNSVHSFVEASVLRIFVHCSNTAAVYAQNTLRCSDFGRLA
jgi:hypothetical protein